MSPQDHQNGTAAAPAAAIGASSPAARPLQRLRRPVNEAHRRRRVRQVLEQAVGRAIGLNIAAKAIYLNGPTPWDPENGQERPWTDADYESCWKWLKEPCPMRVVRGAIEAIAAERKYLPAAAPIPIAPAHLVQIGAAWYWIARCPYCRELHKHSIIGTLQQANPRRALGWRRQRCISAVVARPRGYILVDRDELKNEFSITEKM